MSASIPEIDVERLANAQADGASVIDVREPGEYCAGHVPGAALVPMGQLASRLAALDRTRAVYLVRLGEPKCRDGRSTARCRVRRLLRGRRNRSLGAVGSTH
jgi:hypothetical protein